jgi:hypothetical protein
MNVIAGVSNLGKLENLPTFVGVCSFCKKGHRGALNYYFYKCLQSVWIRFATDSLKGNLSWQTHVKIEQFHLDNDTVKKLTGIIESGSAENELEPRFLLAQTLLLSLSPSVTQALPLFVIECYCC